MLNEHLTQAPAERQADPADVVARLYLARLAASPVPAHLWEGLVGYLVQHRPPGNYLRAVLENDLRLAFRRAENENSAAIFALVNWLVHDVPAGVWGSPEKVAKHLAGRVGA